MKTNSEEPILLRLQGIRKSFGGVRALENVDFELQAGEIHALLGENGAGKTTLIKVLGGIHLPDAGSIVIDSREVPIRGPTGTRGPIGLPMLGGEPPAGQGAPLPPPLRARVHVGLRGPIRPGPGHRRRSLTC